MDEHYDLGFQAGSRQGAADLVAGILRDQLDRRGEAYLILATGASQFDMLAELVRADLDWARVTAFHLDDISGCRRNRQFPQVSPGAVCRSGEDPQAVPLD